MSKGNPNPSPETRFGAERGPTNIGPPKGSQNAAQPGRWRRAIEAALEDMARKKGLVSSEYALHGIAAALLKAAAARDVAALRELGDRLDGKPSQKVEHSGALAIYKPDPDDAELG